MPDLSSYSHAPEMPSDNDGNTLLEAFVPIGWADFSQYWGNGCYISLAVLFAALWIWTSAGMNDGDIWTCYRLPYNTLCVVRFVFVIGTVL